MIVNIKSPEKIIDNIKKELIIAVIDRKHGFHTPVFSNIKKHNQAASRVVVLRKFDPIKMKIIFHTDYRSKKIEEINLCPETNFLFYEKKIKTQLRITTVSKIHYKDKLSKNAWEKSKLSSRKCYLTNASPSSLAKTPTDGLPKHLLGIDPNKDESEKGYNNFSVIDNQIKTIDWLYLSSSGHRRLLITIDNIKNDYQWLIP